LRWAAEHSLLSQLSQAAVGVSPCCGLISLSMLSMSCS